MNETAKIKNQKLSKQKSLTRGMQGNTNFLKFSERCSKEGGRGGGGSNPCSQECCIFVKAFCHIIDMKLA